jgi:hypothetical protein
MPYIYNEKIVHIINEILSNGIWFDPNRLFDYNAYNDHFDNKETYEWKFHLKEKLIFKLIIQNIDPNKLGVYQEQLKRIHFDRCLNKYSNITSTSLDKSINTISRRIYKELKRKNPKIDTI